MTLKRKDDGTFPSFMSSCRFCQHATPSKDCSKRYDLQDLLRGVIAEWHTSYWKELNHAERMQARGCPGFELSKWCVDNNKDHEGNPVVRKTPKSWG